MSLPRAPDAETVTPSPAPPPWRADVSDGGPRLLTSVPALDGMRGAAVLIVVYFHAAFLVPSLRRYAESGGLGVDAFFVLSGFLITALLLREQATRGSVHLGAFYQRRALRLLPALVVLLAVHALYAQVANLSMAAERESVTSVLFYYSNTGLHRLPTTEGLGALWSLAVEEQFYVLWPVIFLVLLSLRRPSSTVLSITIALIVAVCVYRTMLFHQGTPVLYLYTRTTTRADALLIGALLAQLWVRGMVPKRGLTLLAWPALAFYLFTVVHGVGPTFLYNGGYTLIALAVALVILAVLETSWSVNHVLRFGPLRAVGRVSYGLYIWHLFIITAVARYGKDWAPWTRLSVAISLSALACTASFVFVEQPFLRWKVRLDSRDRLPVRHTAENREPTVVMTAETRPKRAPKRFVPATGFVIVCLALVVGGASLWTSRHEPYVSPSTTPTTFALTREVVTVPKVQGSNAYDALADLTRAHLNFELSSQASSAPAGDVISQRPAAGARVRHGTVVHLVLSK
jgi:peptidoglycan/LPS O-acetylase OafA/YrhL